MNAFAQRVGPVAPIDPVLSDEARLVSVAAEIYRHRRLRGRYFPQQLFGEPAWDILLDLYVSAARGLSVSISHACLAADAPPTTAHRWLQALEAEGLVERVRDPSDARRQFARLTATGSARMNAYFASYGSGVPRPLDFRRPPE